MNFQAWKIAEVGSVGGSRFKEETTALAFGFFRGDGFVSSMFSKYHTIKAQSISQRNVHTPS